MCESTKRHTLTVNLPFYFVLSVFRHALRSSVMGRLRRHSRRFVRARSKILAPARIPEALGAHWLAQSTEVAGLRRCTSRQATSHNNPRRSAARAASAREDISSLR